jgi:hypothetical protein
MVRVLVDVDIPILMAILETILCGGVHLMIIMSIVSTLNRPDTDIHRRNIHIVSDLGPDTEGIAVSQWSDT